MKIVSCVAVSTMFLFLLVSTATAASGPSTNGGFHFGLDGADGSIEFEAHVHPDGTLSGGMKLDGVIEVSNEDVDGTGTPGTSLSNVDLQVEFDCLKVAGTRAAMSGVITSANAPEYVGTRTILAVEDNGEGHNAPADRFTWGVYRLVIDSSIPGKEWTPCDAELVNEDNSCADPGVVPARLTWIATDTEPTDGVDIEVGPIDDRRAAADTTGVQYHLATDGTFRPSTSSTLVDCESFPFGSYAFAAIGNGNIQVKP